MVLFFKEKVTKNGGVNPEMQLKAAPTLTVAASGSSEIPLTHPTQHLTPCSSSALRGPSPWDLQQQRIPSRKLGFGCSTMVRRWEKTDVRTITNNYCHTGAAKQYNFIYRYI